VKGDRFGQNPRTVCGIVSGSDDMLRKTSGLARLRLMYVGTQLWSRPGLVSDMTNRADCGGWLGFIKSWIGGVRICSLALPLRCVGSCSAADRCSYFCLQHVTHTSFQRCVFCQPRVVQAKRNGVVQAMAKRPPRRAAMLPNNDDPVAPQLSRKQDRVAPSDGVEGGQGGEEAQRSIVKEAVSR